MCDDGTMLATGKLTKWSNLWLEGCAKMGRPGDCAKSFKKQLEEAGFMVSVIVFLVPWVSIIVSFSNKIQDVVQTIYIWLTNTWPKDKHQKKLGLWSVCSCPFFNTTQLFYPLMSEPVRNALIAWILTIEHSTRTSWLGLYQSHLRYFQESWVGRCKKTMSLWLWSETKSVILSFTLTLKCWPPIPQARLKLTLSVTLFMAESTDNWLLHAMGLQWSFWQVFNILALNISSICASSCKAFTKLSYAYPWPS